eukprot:2379865-Rhodomonas_salina.1
MYRAQTHAGAVQPGDDAPQRLRDSALVQQRPAVHQVCRRARELGPPPPGPQSPSVVLRIRYGMSGIVLWMPVPDIVLRTLTCPVPCYCYAYTYAHPVRTCPPVCPVPCYAHTTRCHTRSQDAYKLYRAGEVDYALLLYSEAAELGYEVAQ